MNDWLRQADVGLALLRKEPNYVGSVPSKFYEYLHHGLPIICTDFPLWKEFINQHDCGTTVLPDDSQAVIEVLRQWQESPDRYQKLSRNARAASKEYQWEEMGNRLTDVYEKLIG